MAKIMLRVILALQPQEMDSKGKTGKSKDMLNGQDDEDIVF